MIKKIIEEDPATVYGQRSIQSIHSRDHPPIPTDNEDEKKSNCSADLAGSRQFFSSSAMQGGETPSPRRLRRRCLLRPRQVCVSHVSFLVRPRTIPCLCCPFPSGRASSPTTQHLREIEAHPAYSASLGVTRRRWVVGWAGRRLRCLKDQWQRRTSEK